MKTSFFFLCMAFTGIVQGQVLKVSPGTNLTIMGGTTFRADNLLFTPSSNFVITNNEVTKSSTIVHASPNRHILRVYKFTNNTGAFNGSIRFAYTDGAELNGIAENLLTLNVHNGTAWQAIAPATRDATNNLILTNGVSVGSMSELTLASSANALPLKWVSFNATKQNETVLLQWATAEEQNTRNFTLLHSSNGISWIAIGTMPASGSSGYQYSYSHINPVSGINYYRILQTDMDGKGSYSNIKTVQFSNSAGPFTILANPVSNNLLTVQVHSATTLALYGADGAVVWQDKVSAGIRYIDVSRFAKGAYLLKANLSAQKVILQ